MHHLVIISILSVCLQAAVRGSDRSGSSAEASQVAKPPFVATAAYSVRRMRGWTVRVNRGLLKEHADLGRRALELLDAKLLDITRAVPEAALTSLRRVPVWLGISDGHAPCAEYHPSRDWLAKNGYNPDKAKCVEIGSAERFLAWSRDQPSMLLHELAHAYHDQVLGFDNAEVEAAFGKARQSGTYDAVLHISGQTKSHYAMTDAKEYFAELTEALFGVNDFYPFVRAELLAHDPTGHALVTRLWRAGR